jgi:hypothetical protein
MAFVLRLELQSSRQGVYTSGVLADCEQTLNIRFQDNDRKHPSPYEDSLLYGNWIHLLNSFQYDKFKFGFSTYAQYRAWFYSNEILAEMQKRGVVLSIYKVEEHYVGHTQAIYRESTATLVAELNPNAEESQVLAFTSQEQNETA